jgi:hypothetical protein
MRERLAIHLSDPFCAGCHVLTDYVGLGLENFDGLGSYRATDNDAPIDASGEIDGEPFANAWQLAGVVAAHDAFGPCLAKTFYQYSQARPYDEAEADTLAWHAEGLAGAEHNVQWLLRDLVLSPAFRRVGEVR